MITSIQWRISLMKWGEQSLQLLSSLRKTHFKKILLNVFYPFRNTLFSERTVLKLWSTLSCTNKFLPILKTSSIICRVIFLKISIPEFTWWDNDFSKIPSIWSNTLSAVFVTQRSTEVIKMWLKSLSCRF